jgi:hypothetical protein
MYSKRILLAATVISVSAMLAACSSDDDDDNAGDAGAEDTSTPVDGGDGGNNSGLAGLDGTWIQACLADDPEDAETEYTTAEAVFNGNAVTVTEMAYTDSGCTTAAEPAVYVIQSSIVFPGGTTLTALGDASHADITTESATLDGESVSDALSSLFGLNETTFDILLIDNNILYAGDIDGDLDGSTEALRPTELDTRVVLTRQ